MTKVMEREEILDIFKKFSESVESIMGQAAKMLIEYGHIDPCVIKQASQVAENVQQASDQIVATGIEIATTLQELKEKGY